MNDDNTIFVSNKRSVVSFVLAAVTMFNRGAELITFKARGKAITRAIDSVEVLRNKFMTDINPKNITIGIGTETYENADENGNKDGTKTALSTIEIIVRRPKQVVKNETT